MKPTLEAQRAFASKKFRWLEKVARDWRKLPPLATPLCIWFCHQFNLANGGGAWPYQATIAEALGVHRETINRVLAALVARGHLQIVRQGRDRPNLYHMVIDDGARCEQPITSSEARCDPLVTSSDPHDVIDQRSRCDRSPGYDVINRSHRSSSKTPAKKEREKKDSRAARSRESLSPGFASREKKKEAVRRKESEAGPQPRSTAELAEGFERFWSAYPRKVAKEAARKAWAKAIKGGVELETLIAGAQRYAAERAGQDPKFTKHPATWLNAGCWQDEMPAGAVIDQAGNVVAIEQPPPQREDESQGVYERALEMIETVAAAAGPDSWWAGGKS
jgi:hypothetical protein